jgi:diguanylate cyclase (GGDEF)-like protein/excisionase family DNA binding protein
VTLNPPTRPLDATLSVTRAARLLGVHPNTVRAWSDAGRLRYYRINARGDRRYRLGDLQRFLAAAQGGLDAPPAPILTVPRRRSSQGQRSAIEPGSLQAQPAAPADLALLALLSDVVARGRELDVALGVATRTLRDAWALAAVGIWERVGGRLVPRAMAGPARPNDLPESFGVLGRALEVDGPVLMDELAAPDVPMVIGRGRELALPIPGEDGAWGVLWLAGEDEASLSEREVAPAETAARILAAAVRAGRLAEEVSHQLHRADALRRVAADIGSRLDLDQILSGLVDHAMVLFEADRAAVFLRHGDGTVTPEVSRGLSSAYLAAVRPGSRPSLQSEAAERRRAIFAMAYEDDPRAAAVRTAVVQEGFDTICSAPLHAGDDLLGMLDIHHDRPHPWAREELETLEALAAQASVAINAAQDYSQMATWAAQLQSIQQLGTRLSRLTVVQEIGNAIATELRQLIDYHNVRVYRVVGSDLVPVAMHGRVGEYSDETPDQLRVQVGTGITGWVAEHGVPQYLPDAARDERAETIPGTDDDLDESMLLAPLVYEERVIGVLVLSKLGLDQFGQDDLRLLTIYASFAAQAMANADATERLQAQSEALERQLLRQRELLRLTESVLTTLETDELFDMVVDRLGALVRYDTVSIELRDPTTGRLRSVIARGVHAAEFLADGQSEAEGVAGWVIAHNESVLIDDERRDPRVRALPGVGAVDGSLVVVPLRDRQGVSGVLVVERLGDHDRFTPDESELIQLFAAQVSIALRNATIHAAAETRARTDDRTGLLNHAAFVERLVRAVTRGEPFGLIMLDLDDFRAVNNALGHQAGDRYLREVGQAVRRAGRESDQVFRYGGDEFVLILPGSDAVGARIAAERVRAAVAEAGRELGGIHAQVGASIGIAAYPDDGDRPDEILLAADRACFVAKRTGRDRIATAAEGLALVAEFSLQAPTPIDPPAGLERTPEPGAEGRSQSDA